MSGLNISSEVLSAIIVIAFFLIYPLVFKDRIKKGFLKGRKVLIFVSVLLVMFSLLLCFDWISGGFESDGDIYYLAPLITILFGGAVYFFGEGFLVKGKFDETKIVFQTPWTGRKECNWSLLKDVNFCSTSNSCILEFEGGLKIRVSKFLLGYSNLLDLVETLGFEIDGS